MRLDGREFGFRPPCLVLGWVTVFGHANRRSMSASHPGQLSATGNDYQLKCADAVLCGWGVKTMAHFNVDKRVGGRLEGKTV